MIRKNNTYPLFGKETEEHKYTNNEENKIYNKNKNYNIRIGVKENKDLLNEKIKKLNYMEKDNAKEKQEKQEIHNNTIKLSSRNQVSNIRLDFKSDFHNISGDKLEEIYEKKNKN